MTEIETVNFYSLGGSRLFQSDKTARRKLLCAVETFKEKTIQYYDMNNIDLITCFVHSVMVGCIVVRKSQGTARM